MAMQKLMAAIPGLGSTPFSQGEVEKQGRWF